MDPENLDPVEKWRRREKMKKYIYIYFNKIWMLEFLCVCWWWCWGWKIVSVIMWWEMLGCGERDSMMNEWRRERWDLGEDMFVIFEHFKGYKSHFHTCPMAWDNLAEGQVWDSFLRFLSHLVPLCPILWSRQTWDKNNQSHVVLSRPAYQTHPQGFNRSTVDGLKSAVQEDICPNLVGLKCNIRIHMVYFLKLQLLSLTFINNNN